MSNPEENSLPAITLKQFIDENEKSLTALGVFVAIAALSANLSVKLVAAFISISAITCAALIVFDIWKWSLKGRRPTLTLMFFSVSLSLLTLNLLIYCFSVLDGIYPDIPFLILTLLLVELEAWGIKKFSDRFARFKATVERLKSGKFWKFIIVPILLLVALFVARAITNRIEVPIFTAVVEIIKISSAIKGPIQ